MDSDHGKIFVGGISWDTTEERLKEYFGAYGEVVDVVIMKDRTTRRARGFGFVVFADPSVADRVIQEKHTIDGRNVEAKKVVPRDEQQTAQRTSNTAGPRTKKIFVGGLAPTVTEDDFRKYFEQFGNITDVVVMYDHTTQRHRGFGFITYDSEDAVDKVLQQTFHELKEKTVEVKRAIPKEMSPGNTRGPAGRGTSYGGPYMQGYGPSPVGAYGVRPPLASSGYSPYGAAPAYAPTGYGSTPGYGTNMNGGYGAAPVYGAAAGYAGGAAGSYGAGFSTAPGSAPYGSGTAGYAAAAVPAPYGNAVVGARTGWGAGGGAESQRWIKNSWILILQCAVMLTALQNQSCSAACGPPTVQCGANTESCYLTNYRGEWEDRNSCKAAKAFFPKTESELIHAVAYAVKKEKKMKVITGSAHSLNRFACPGGNSGVVISTRDYNSRITVDEKSMTVTVDAGVTVRELVDTLAVKGLALRHTTDWDRLSMAGVICMAAHGSSLWGKGGGIHEYVVGISMVLPALADDGYAKIIHFTEKDEALKAARVSLGVLGAISQVTFSVEKMFKRSVTLKLKDDSDLEISFLEFAKSHEFGLMNWYPSFSKVAYSRQDRVPIDVPGNGKLAPFQPRTVKSVIENRALEELNNAKINASNLCKLVRTQVEQRIKTGNRYLNDGQTFRGFPVVGYNHLLQSSSGCQMDAHNEENNLCPWKGKELKSNDTICSWDTEVKGSFYHHTSIAIPLSRITEAIRDLKQLRDMDPSALSTFGSYLGVEFRYFKKSTNYLSHKEDSVVIEFMYFRYREPGRPRWNGHIIDEIEQMLLEKYGGVPHWGKNRVYTFEGAAKRTVNLGKFLEVKKQLDPKGYFSSEWSDGVLGIGKGVQIWRDGCALDGLCVCKEDRHCASDKGFVCRAGKIWKNASVCIQV